MGCVIAYLSAGLRVRLRQELKETPVLQQLVTPDTKPSLLFSPICLRAKFGKFRGKLGGLLDALEVGLGLLQEVDMRQQPLPHPRHLFPTRREN